MHFLSMPATRVRHVLSSSTSSTCTSSGEELAIVARLPATSLDCEKLTADALDGAAPRDAALASLAPGTAHLAGCPPRSLLDRSDSPLRTVPAAACWPLPGPSAARARVKPLKVHRQVRQSPKGRFFSSARRPNKQTWHNPLAESRFSVSGSWKKSAPFGISDFWTRLSTFFFSKFSRWEVGGSTVEKPNLGSDVARGRAGTRLAEKKTMTEQTVQGLRGELPIRRETGDWRPYGTRIGLGAHPEPRAGVQLAKRGPRDSAIRGPDPSRTLNAHARFHAPLSLKWPLSLPPPPP